MRSAISWNWLDIFISSRNKNKYCTLKNKAVTLLNCGFDEIKDFSSDTHHHFLDTLLVNLVGHFIPPSLAFRVILPLLFFYWKKLRAIGWIEVRYYEIRPIALVPLKCLSAIMAAYQIWPKLHRLHRQNP